MQETFSIKKVAILGAGVMGAQIAAQAANAGFKVVLFDLGAKEGPKNQLVDAAIQRLLKLKPAPLGSSALITRIEAANYDDELAKLKDCDLIIEAIAERIDLKEALYQKIAPHVHQRAILASNTSGLSINQLMQVLPEELHSRFCGVHFFNPPRYMRLVELIPCAKTDALMLNELETWLTTYLGKGIVRAKDTPNFIANRIGVFSMLSVLKHAENMNMSPDEVDALTGPLLGRPKSATMRTMDVVGLDTMKHVVTTMQTQLKDDPWFALFKMPNWIEGLIEKGALGQKSGQGIYRKVKNQIEVFQPKTGEYAPSNASAGDAITAILRIEEGKERMKALFESEDRQARFVAACFRDLFHYCAYHLSTIAETVREIDLALRWGFGWAIGPFETWQLFGKEDCDTALKAAISSSQTLAQAALPAWLDKAAAFYQDGKALSPLTLNFKSASELPVYKKHLAPDTVVGEKRRRPTALFENEGVVMWHVKDEVAALSFKTKSNTFNSAVLEGINQAIAIAEEKFRGLVLYQQDSQNFSSGANLKDILTQIKAGKPATPGAVIDAFHLTGARIRYSSIPVVAALRGRALGGGLETLLHCDAIVAAFESYPGLVEVGVGLIPAGGGCKEMAKRAGQNAQYGEVMNWLEPYFKQIATAKVSSSAIEAKEDGYLRPGDTIVMHVDEVLAVAVDKVKQLSYANYLPPVPEKIKIAGLEGKARIQTGLVNWLAGGFISEHDYTIAVELAHVLCGGNLNRGEMVDEAWLLKLEKESFLRLCETKQTQDRIEQMLNTGKALRN